LENISSIPKYRPSLHRTKFVLVPDDNS